VIVVNIRESGDKLESRSLNDCWDNLLPEGINDVQRLPNQKYEIWNICVSLFIFQKKDFHSRMRLILWKFLTFMLLSRGGL
jgi:hypothetical protein